MIEAVRSLVRPGIALWLTLILGCLSVYLTITTGQMPDIFQQITQMAIAFYLGARTAERKT
jgi:uncharacterized membrane protein AbrB (regulator of aidB expression)